MNKKIYLIPVIVLSLIIFQLFSFQVQPIIKKQAEKEIKQYLQLIINHVSFLNKTDYKKVVNIKYKEGKIVSMGFNMVYINNITGKYVNRIETTMQAIEDGKYKSIQDTIYNQRLKKFAKEGIVIKIPIGMFFNNIFLADVGPKIKIRYQGLSIVSSNINKSLKNYGINHIAISIDLQMKIKLMIIAPFYRQSYQEDFVVPFVFEIIEGEVPSWYHQ